MTLIHSVEEGILLLVWIASTGGSLEWSGVDLIFLALPIAFAATVVVWTGWPCETLGSQWRHDHARNEYSGFHHEYHLLSSKACM